MKNLKSNFFSAIIVFSLHNYSFALESNLSIPAKMDNASCSAPTYPIRSRAIGEEGVVELKFNIDSLGKVVQSEIVKSSGYKRLDIAALEALSKCSFSPAVQDGKPVESWSSIKYNWKIEDLKPPASQATQVSSTNSNKPQPLPLENLKQLASVFTMIKNDLYSTSGINDDDLVNGAIKGMVKLADPEGEYFTKEEFKAFRAGSDSSLGSIGVELTNKNNSITIVSPIENQPAERFGLKAGDVIIAINGEEIANKSLTQVTSLLRGPIGSLVSIKIKKIINSEYEILNIPREKTIPKTESLSKIDEDIWILKIHAFNDVTLKNVSNLFNNQISDRKIKLLIIDLRNNPGGLFDTTIGLSSLFLPENTEVGRTVGKKETIYEASLGKFFPLFPIKNEIASNLKQVPLAVLINEGTASGAEILALSLKETNRATLLGRNTFGRGSIQTVKQLGPDTALKITTSVWQSLKNYTLSNTGVIPDYYLDKKEPQVELFQALIKLKENRKF